MMRTNTKDEYKALKSATRRQIKASGGLESAASVTRVEVSRLGQYQQPQHPSYMPIDVVTDLTTDSNETEILQTMAGIANCLLLPLPPQNLDTLAIDFVKFGQEVATSFSDYHRALIAAPTMNEILPKERASLEEDFERIATVVAHMLSTLRSSPNRDDSGE